MRGRLVSLTAAALLLTGATRPPTETDLGTRIARPKRAEIRQGHYTNEESGRIAIREFARCVFASKPARVATVLEMSAGTEGEALNNLADDECLQEGVMEFSIPLFRGALFAEMFRRHEADKARPWTYPIPPLNFSVQPSADSNSAARTNYFLLTMTDCLYAADPETVKAVVVNETASVAQKTAYAKLIPQLGPCVPSGATITFSRALIESAFGEYLYRSLVPPIPVTAGKAN